MKDKDVMMMMSVYKSIRSKEVCENDIEQQFNLANHVAHLIKRESLIEDAVSVALNVEAKRMKMALVDTPGARFGKTVETIDVLLELEDGARSAAHQGPLWFNCSSLYDSDIIENMWDAARAEEIEERLSLISRMYENDVAGLHSLTDIVFNIYNEDISKTLKEAKKHVLTSNQKRVLESINRGDVVASKRSRRNIY